VAVTLASPTESKTHGLFAGFAYATLTGVGALMPAARAEHEVLSGTAAPAEPELTTNPVTTTAAAASAAMPMRARLRARC
jgi:hypothetical protein